MALQVMVSKVWPVSLASGHYIVGVEVVLTDDSVEVRRTTFTETANKTADVSLLSTVIISKVQEWINTYKAERTVNVHPKYTALVTAVQNGLTV